MTREPLPRNAISGQVLEWNGAAWAPATLSGGASNATATAPGLVQLAGDLAGTATAPTVPALAGKANTSALAAVATSGKYTDLSGAPALATVATSGKYTDLSGAPALATVATSGSYADLSNKPVIPAAPIYARKPADTSLASTNTLAWDPDLVATIPAAGAYLLELSVLCYNLGGPNLVTQWINMATASSGWQIPVTFINVQSSSASAYSGGLFTSSSGVSSTVGGQSTLMQASGVITYTGTGQVGLQWTQSTSSASQQTLRAGSWLRLTKIA